MVNKSADITSAAQEMPQIGLIKLNSKSLPPPEYLLVPELKILVYLLSVPYSKLLLSSRKYVALGLPNTYVSFIQLSCDNNHVNGDTSHSKTNGNGNGDGNSDGTGDGSCDYNENGDLIAMDTAMVLVVVVMALAVAMMILMAVIVDHQEGCIARD